MSSTTAYIHADFDDLSACLRDNDGTREPYAVIDLGEAGVIMFGHDRPDAVAARLRELADQIDAETARLRAEAAGQQTLEVA